MLKCQLQIKDKNVQIKVTLHLKRSSNGEATNDSEAVKGIFFLFFCFQGTLRLSVYWYYNKKGLGMEQKIRFIVQKKIGENYSKYLAIQDKRVMEISKKNSLLNFFLFLCISPLPYILGFVNIKSLFGIGTYLQLHLI